MGMLNKLRSGDQREPAWSGPEGGVGETLWGGGLCGLSLLGLSGENSSPPPTPPPAPLSLQPKGGHHPPPTHPQKLG